MRQNIIFKGVNHLLHNQKQFADSVLTRFFGWLPDKMFISLKYRIQMGYFIDWKNPKTFNEKINWLKIYNRKPEYTTMVDKYAVKEYVANIIGDEYIIPTIGVWNTAEEIEWKKLPNQFVLKTTHGGGGCGVVVCSDIHTFDKQAAIEKLTRSLHSDAYTNLREWPYKNVPRRIIAEKYMAPKASSAPKDLEDYKFFCFNGEPVYCQVIRDRNTNETIDFYDMEWNHQVFVGLNPKCRNGIKPVPRPTHLEDMIRVCRDLSKGIPFVRVDLYVIDEKEYFGELTFYPASGIGHFTPVDWEKRIGDLLKLPIEIGGGYKCLIRNNMVDVSETPAKYEDLKDYKFFCFNGKVKLFKVDFNRFQGHRANYYTPTGELLHFGEKFCEPDYNHIENLPSNLADMVSIAEKMSIDIPFVRVDLYNIKGSIYFGEATFFPAGGMGAFTNQRWDFTLGEYINLNNNESYK